MPLLLPPIVKLTVLYVFYGKKIKMLLIFIVNCVVWLGTRHGSIVGRPNPKCTVYCGRERRKQRRKKAKVVESAGKVMVTVLWDSKDVLLDWPRSRQHTIVKYYKKPQTGDSKQCFDSRQRLSTRCSCDSRFSWAVSMGFFRAPALLAVGWYDAGLKKLYLKCIDNHGSYREK